MSSAEFLNTLGGEDEKTVDDKDPPYCDKIHHFLRSLANQPNHFRHVREIIGPDPGKPRPEVLSRLSQEWFRGHIPVIRSRNQK